MNVFIGMETSGTIRRLFQERGHFVVSVDRLAAEDGSTSHIAGDVFEIFAKLNTDFDVGIFHPTCTYLTNSAAWAFKDGPYHQAIKPGTLVGAARRIARDAALNDVRRCMALSVKRSVIENPVGAISTAIRPPDQIVQPWQFGDDASKATCFWFKNVPPLPINQRLYVRPRLVCTNCKRHNDYEAKFEHGCRHCGAEPALLLPRWANQTDSGQNRLSPTTDRWKDRSRTYPGIARALVDHLCLLDAFG